MKVQNKRIPSRNSKRFLSSGVYFWAATLRWIFQWLNNKTVYALLTNAPLRVHMPACLCDCNWFLQGMYSILYSTVCTVGVSAYYHILSNVISRADVAWVSTSKGNASETKANESLDNGVFFDIEAKRTPSIVSKLFSKRNEHIR